MKICKQVVYAFMFTYCIHESAMSPMNIHLTKKGAYRSMRKFLNDSYMEWYNERITYGKSKDKFGQNTFHNIRPLIVQP